MPTRRYLKHVLIGFVLPFVVVTLLWRTSWVVRGLGLSAATFAALALSEWLSHRREGPPDEGR